MLIYAYGSVRVEATYRWRLAFNGTNGLGLVVAQRLAEGVIVLQRNNGLREIVEVPAQDVRGVVHCVASPIESLAISWWGIECGLQLLDSFF